MTPVSDTGEGLGLQAEGPAVGHVEGCQCVRCTGFLPGHQLSVGNRGQLSHGAYSVIRLSDRAEAIVETLRDELPAGSRADQTTLELLAIALAQVETAQLALVKIDELLVERPLATALADARERKQRLRQDMRGWLHTAHRLAESLGLSSKSRADLGLTVAEIQRAHGRQLLDLKRLSEDELVQLQSLTAKARAVPADEEAAA